MGNSFAVSGTVRKASSGRSLVIELVNLQGKHYVSVKNIQDVIAGHKKRATVWIPKDHPRPRYIKKGERLCRG